MYAIILLRYLVPLERLSATVDRHRAYLRELHAAKKLIASGPLVPNIGVEGLDAL